MAHQGGGCPPSPSPETTVEETKALLTVGPRALCSGRTSWVLGEHRPGSESLSRGQRGPVSSPNPDLGPGGHLGRPPCSRTPVPAGAWILTSALRVGLARYVGQAVRDHSLASTSTKARVVAIGIASLGRVLHCQLLDHAQVGAGLWALRPWGTVAGQGGPQRSAASGLQGTPDRGHQGHLAG